MKLHMLTLLSISLIVGRSSSDNHSSNNDKSDDTALVYIDNGAIQCESKGKTPAQTAQILINYGIDVISSKCAVSGAVATVCGGKTAGINLHEIWPQNISDAIEQGFSKAEDLEEYQVVECQQNPA
ncbi:MAG TPA: hypothetical protein EYH06_04340 [Chromatiales bacterium]|nr:hypothetical protein [Thiotrichales bacterium]HIP67803.1 hypothetical protein [Chromatiales bacterium]